MKRTLLSLLMVMVMLCTIAGDLRALESEAEDPAVAQEEEQEEQLDEIEQEVQLDESEQEEPDASVEPVESDPEAVETADTPTESEEEAAEEEPEAPEIAEEAAEEEPEAEVAEEEEWEPSPAEAEDGADGSATHVAPPEITGITPNQETGFTITWNAVEGAYKYRLYYQNETSWKTIGTTTETSLTHTGLTNNTKYTYTVRALNQAGEYISGYNPEGWSATYHTIPELTEVTSVYHGMKVTWKKVKGAAGYKVYAKKDGKWKALVTTDETSILDKDVVSGQSYSYRVRTLAKDGKVSSYYTSKGITGTFVAPPQITKIENNKATGSTVTWGAVEGAYQYRLYVKQDNSWKVVGKTKETSLAHTGLKDHTEYLYTVRALDKNGNPVSSYKSAGWSNLFLAPPSISTISQKDGGLQLKWKDVNPDRNYRIYRKTLGGSWEKVADVAGTSYVDKAFPKDKICTYTLRCLNKKGNRFTSYFDKTGYGVYYLNGKLASGQATTPSGDGYYFKDGVPQKGFIKIGKKTYSSNSVGILQKDGIVGSKKEGYRYADKNGAIDTSFTGMVKKGSKYWYCKKGVFDFTYTNAVTYKKDSWIVQKGIGTKATSSKDLTLWRAMKIVYKITDDSMTQKEKLWKCFRYAQTEWTEGNPRIPHYHGSNWEILYANDMFVNGHGNCFSYGAAFAFMAKALGYKNVYACNSGGHGWAEVDGLVYDPEWGRGHTDRTYFGIDYNKCSSPNYKGAISAGYSWMRVKI